MAGLHIPKPDGTEGTATAKITYKEGKLITFTMYGCIVENDANLQRFLGNHIDQSADMKKFKNNKYFFYAYDSNFEERNYLRVTVTCHRFSKPSKPKPCNMKMSPDVFVKVQDHHIFLVCDSPEFNESKFLKNHSKKIRVAQNNLTKLVYGLSCEEEEEEEEHCPKFIKLTLNPESSNEYRIESKYPETLRGAGPVLLEDNKTVVGSYEIKGNKLISISIFGSNQDNKRKVDSSGSCEEVEEESEQQSDQKARSQHLRDLTQEKELSEEKDENLTPQENCKNSEDAELVEGNQECTDPKLSINESGVEEKKSTPQSSQSEVLAGEDQKPHLKLAEDLEDMKTIKQDEITAQKIPVEEYGSQPVKENGTSKQGQEHEYKFPDLDQTDSKVDFHPPASTSHSHHPKCNPEQQHDASSDSSQYSMTDTWEGIVHQQATTQNETFASQDETKLTVNMKKGASEEQSKFTLNKEKENDILTLPLKQDQGSSFGEKSPIPETSESPIKDSNPLQEIIRTLPDGPRQIHDNLRLKNNPERYRRFLLHVAQNATRKWLEIGERLGIKNNKLESLEVDYSHEGSAEQAYQMLVCWRESDNKPTLEKLLLALIDTGLRQVAEEIPDMLIDRRNRGGNAVTEKLLNEITNDVLDVWKFLGRYLAINENGIRGIKKNNEGNTREQARQMFVKWKQSNGKRATTGVLVNALQDVGKTNVADKVRD